MNDNSYESLETEIGESYNPFLIIAIVSLIIVLIYIVFYKNKTEDKMSEPEIEESSEIEPLEISDSESIVETNFEVEKETEKDVEKEVEKSNISAQIDEAMEEIENSLEDE